MLTFTEAKEVPNTRNPNGEPWIALGYAIPGRKPDNWTFGNAKAYVYLKNLDDMIEAKKAHNPENGLFSFTVIMNEGSKFQTEQSITSSKLELLIHYRGEIEDYLANHPYVPFRRTAIENPVVKTEEVGIDYQKVLYLPCWEKKEEDDGEGLIPKKFTQKNAKFLLEKAFNGSALKTFSENLAKKEDASELVDKYKTQSGEIMETKYDLSVQKCVLKYKSHLMSFAMLGKLDDD